jgi:hypothetical protein
MCILTLNLTGFGHANESTRLVAAFLQGGGTKANQRDISNWCEYEKKE